MGAISGEEAIAIANQYTEESLAGAGAVAGVPCQIQSITDITGGHRVTFLWVDNNGDSHTSSMDVLNGVNGQDGRDGADGKGIKAVTINEEDHLIITYSDDTTSDAGKIEIQSAVDSVNGKTGAVTLDASDVGALPDDTAIPTKTSNLTNDSGFITKAVNDLINYYLKSETYSKTEVDNIITAVKNSRFEYVATLPTTDIKTNVIYLVPKSPSQTSNVKDEYINLDGTTSGWEKIGDTEIDLSGYVTTQALNTALAAYTTTADLTTLLAAKQDTLTFDDAPTENSNNPVKSGGVYTADDKIYQVMGQNSAKNFIPFDLDKIKAKNTTGTWNGNVYSLNGIDFTFNSDGTVDASGTATETASVHYYDPVGLPSFGGDRILRLTGCPSGGGSGTTYKVMAYRAGEVDGSAGTAEDYGDGISLKWLNNGSGIKAFISISVYTGAGTIDVTFKPMLRLSTDTDNTFAPYAKTNQELTAENQTLTNNVDVLSENGAINMLQNNATTTTIRSVVFTVNNDGTVTANGTQDGTGGGSYLHVSDTFTCDSGTYKLTGCPSGGSQTKYRVYVYDHTSGSTGEVANASDIGNGAIFNLQSGHEYNINIMIGASETVSNLVFKPMITKPEYSGDYVPYAKTNRELTKDVANTMRVVHVSDVSIFDIISDLNSYPAKTEYFGFSGFITNGSSTLGDLLSTGEYGVVSIKKYDEWHITISIISGNSNGKTHMASTNKNNTSIKFVNNDPNASTDKVTSTTINKAT